MSKKNNSDNTNGTPSAEEISADAMVDTNSTNALEKVPEEITLGADEENLLDNPEESLDSDFQEDDFEEDHLEEQELDDQYAPEPLSEQEALAPESDLGLDESSDNSQATLESEEFERNINKIFWKRTKCRVYLCRRFKGV